MRAFIDSGWLFLLAGATIVAAAVLIPPHDDLQRLRSERDEMRQRELEYLDRLAAYSAFERAIEEEDPDLIRRLAAAHLNLVPANSTATAMIGTELDASVERWISATLPPPQPAPALSFKDSWLRRLSTGPARLWTFAIGMCLVFVGLLPRVVRKPMTSTSLDEACADLNDEDTEIGLKSNTSWSPSSGSGIHTT